MLSVSPGEMSSAVIITMDQPSARSSLPTTFGTTGMQDLTSQRASLSAASKLNRSFSNAGVAPGVGPRRSSRSAMNLRKGSQESLLAVQSANLSNRRSEAGSDSGGAINFKSPFGAAYIASSSRGVDSSKIKTLSRKLSRSEDLKLDLSRPTSENARLSGLPLHSRSSSDLSGRRGSTHSRSASKKAAAADPFGFMFKSTTTFVHPGRQVPRPYTPPGVRARKMSRANAATAAEDDDMMDLDGPLHGRSMSITSISGPSGPITRSASVSNRRGSIMKLSNMSTSNISMKSVRQSISRRRSSVLSSDIGGRTSDSFDRNFSFLRRASSRASMSEDPAARRASIAAARRAFEDKEAMKEEEEMRKRGKNAQRGRRRVEGLVRPKMVRKPTNEEVVSVSPPDSPMEEDKPVIANPIAADFAAHMALYDLPVKTEHRSPSKKHAAKDAMLRFTTWGKTRLLSVK